MTTELIVICDRCGSRPREYAKATAFRMSCDRTTVEFRPDFDHELCLQCFELLQAWMRVKP